MKRMHVSVILLGATLVGITGCASTPILPGLSTAASMQVEVDVYKGPLTRSLPAQISDTAGALDATLDALRAYVREHFGRYPSVVEMNARSQMAYICKEEEDAYHKLSAAAASEPNRKEVQELGKAREVYQLCNEALDVLEALAKLLPEVRTMAANLSTANGTSQRVIAQIEAKGTLPSCTAGRAVNDCRDEVKWESARKALQSLGSSRAAQFSASDYESLVREGTALGVLQGNDIKDLQTGRAALADLDKLFMSQAFSTARSMEERAYYWSTEGIGENVRTRAHQENVIRFAQLLADGANFISTRLEAVGRQFEGKQASNFSTADHLRDTEPTDYLQLYNWFLPDERGLLAPGGRAFGPTLGNRSPDGLRVDDRVRIAERLFDDRYWTNINRVFASGQGEVRMAFIRDEIGNWNLKSFDSDPEELLSAYRNASIAGLRMVTNLATKVSSGGSISTETLGLMDRFTQGRVDTPDALQRLQTGLRTTREDTKKALEKIAATFASDTKQLRTDVESSKNDVAAAQGPLTTANAAVDEQQQLININAGQISVYANAEDEAGLQRLAQLRAERVDLLTELEKRRDRASAAQKILAQHTAALNEHQGRLNARGAQALADARRELEALRRAIDLAGTMVTPSSSSVPQAPGVAYAAP